MADAYVRDGSYASTNFGSAPELVAKVSATAVYAREAFLKLDISGVQTSDSVRLRLYGHLSDTRATSVTTQIHPVANTSWEQDTLTWNNSRSLAGASVLGSVTVAGTAPQWYEVDLTEHVQAQKATGATLIAIALKNAVDTPPYSSFGSRESANGPQVNVD